MARWWSGFGVGGRTTDDLELGRLKATDKEDSLWGMKQQEEDINKGKSEVDLYLLERAEKLNDRFDVLAWWKNSLVKFPILSMIARDVFAMPVSTVASESAFSTGGRILDPFRSSLTPKIVEGLILTGNWLQAICPIAEPRVVQEHAQNEDESVDLLDHYINVETGKYLIFMWNYQICCFFINVIYYYVSLLFFFFCLNLNVEYESGVTNEG